MECLLTPLILAGDCQRRRKLRQPQLEPDCASASPLPVPNTLPPWSTQALGASAARPRLQPAGTNVIRKPTCPWVTDSAKRHEDAGGAGCDLSCKIGERSAAVWIWTGSMLPRPVSLKEAPSLCPAAEWLSLANLHFKRNPKEGDGT